jgi:hypothetical protein
VSSWGKLVCFPFQGTVERITGEAKQVYGEIYTSDAFLNETEQVRRHGQLPPDDLGCVREKVVAAVMFASDATQLTQFGDTKAWLVFESPVQSGFLTPRALDRDQSFKSEIVTKTGLNRYGLVFVGLLQSQDRSKPVMVQTGPKPV